ncbi:hypothetical protein ASG31_09645 [Chryseobacterium sp. Leaf404]|nr:hypothetical protein ASG31_09645 [Chryseobacterium sp. Leaf404]
MTSVGFLRNEKVTADFMVTITNGHPFEKMIIFNISHSKEIRFRIKGEALLINLITTNQNLNHPNLKF